LQLEENENISPYRTIPKGSSENCCHTFSTQIAKVAEIFEILLVYSAPFNKDYD